MKKLLLNFSDILTGSIPWMPPETLKSYEYSKKSDVWSFGVFLWETLSCRIPFENYQFQVVMFAVSSYFL
jgi:serine/threonine protein kinase